MSRHLAQQVRDCSKRRLKGLEENMVALRSNRSGKMMLEHIFKT